MHRSASAVVRPHMSLLHSTDGRAVGLQRWGCDDRYPMRQVRRTGIGRISFEDQSQCDDAAVRTPSDTPVPNRAAPLGKGFAATTTSTPTGGSTGPESAPGIALSVVPQTASAEPAHSDAECRTTPAQAQQRQRTCAPSASLADHTGAGLVAPTCTQRPTADGSAPAEAASRSGWHGVKGHALERTAGPANELPLQPGKLLAGKYMALDDETIVGIAAKFKVHQQPTHQPHSCSNGIARTLPPHASDPSLRNGG